MQQRSSTIKSYNLTQQDLNLVLTQYQNKGISKPTIIDTLKECGNDLQQFEEKINQQCSIQIDNNQAFQGSMKFGLSPIRMQSTIIIHQDQQRVFNIFALQDQLRQDQSVPAGLINLGNSCFLNIIMQCLYNCVAFRNLILQLSQPQTPNAASDFLKSTQELFALMQFGNKKYLDPSDFLAKLNEYKSEAALSTYEQNDYNEALVLLLEAFEEAMKETDNQKSASYFHSLFYGQSQESLVCQDKTVRTSETEFTSISLEAKEDLITAFRASCTLYIDDYQPGQNAKIIQKINQPPLVLQFHINRVSYDIKLFELSKSNNTFEFQENIDIDEFLTQYSVIKSNDLNILEKKRSDYQEKIRKLQNKYDLDDIIQEIKYLDLNEFPPTSQFKPQTLFQQLVGYKQVLQEKKNELDQQLEKLNGQIDQVKKQKKILNNYILTGILIHSGNAQFGHYYCYLKQGDTWWKFNDRQVYQTDYLNAYQDSQGAIFQANNVIGVIYSREIKQPLQLQHLNPSLKKFVETERDKFLTEMDQEIVMSLKNTLNQKIFNYQRLVPLSDVAKAFQQLVYPEMKIVDPDLKSAYIKFQICKQEIQGNKRLNFPQKQQQYVDYFFNHSAMLGNYKIEQIMSLTQPYEELSNKLLSVKLDERITIGNLLQMAKQFEKLCAYLQETKEKALSTLTCNLYNAILLKGIFFIDLMHQQQNLKAELKKEFALSLFSYTHQIQTQKPFIYPFVRNQLTQFFQENQQLVKSKSVCQNKYENFIDLEVQVQPEAFLKAIEGIDCNTKPWQNFVKLIEQQGKILTTEYRQTAESPYYFEEQ